MSLHVRRKSMAWKPSHRMRGSHSEGAYQGKRWGTWWAYAIKQVSPIKKIPAYFEFPFSQRASRRFFDRAVNGADHDVTVGGFEVVADFEGHAGLHGLELDFHGFGIGGKDLHFARQVILIGLVRGGTRTRAHRLVAGDHHRAGV
jgi:hypothetical protein